MKLFFKKKLLIFNNYNNNLFKNLILKNKIQDDQIFLNVFTDGR
jgi:hypothetical protein